MAGAVRLLIYFFGWWLFLLGFNLLVIGRAAAFYVTSGAPIYAWHGYSFSHGLYLIPLFFLLRRISVWARAKSINPPSTFSGWRYALTALPVGISLAAVIFTYGLALSLHSPGISGIPMGFLVAYCSFVAFPVMLITELLDLRPHGIANS
jgi:hypothetical protein